MKKRNFIFITGTVIISFVSFGICLAQKMETPIIDNAGTINNTVAVNNNTTISTPSPTTDVAPSLDVCRELEKGDFERVQFLKDKKQEEFDKIIFDCERTKVTPVPVLLSYKVVRDNFGKRVGSSFVVVQVNIQNKSATNEFYLTDLQVWLDPNQCREMVKSFNDKTSQLSDSDLTIKVDSKYFECIEKFDKYFKYPIVLEPVQPARVEGVATASQYRSPRKIGFQAANFVAGLSSVFTGLNLLGRDGISGLGFLGTSVIPGAEKAIPDISSYKMENLRSATEDETIIVKPNSNKIVNVFIETDSFFNQDTWQLYKSKLKKTNNDALEFRRLLRLFIVSRIDGILINNNSKKASNTGSNTLIRP